MKKSVRILLFIIIANLLICLFIFIVNETPVCYTEPEDYSEFIDREPSELIHKNASPIFHIEGNDTAIIFVHGFPGTPAEVRYFSQRAIDDGYDVLSPLLPGFGTSVDDLKQTYFTQWYNYVQDLYEEHRLNYEYFFVVGVSMGGTITLKIAEEFSDNEQLTPTGIATISAPVFINSLLENCVVYNPSLYFVRIGSFFTDEMKWVSKIYTEDGSDRAISYTGSALPKQGYSFKMAMKEVKSDLYKISVPIFLAHSKRDKIIPYKNLFYITKNISSESISIKIYNKRGIRHTHHVLTAYNSTRDSLYNNLIYFIGQQTSE
jgi:carboxylesterase